MTKRADQNSYDFITEPRAIITIKSNDPQSGLFFCQLSLQINNEEIWQKRLDYSPSAYNHIVSNINFYVQGLDNLMKIVFEKNISCFPKILSLEETDQLLIQIKKEIQQEVLKSDSVADFDLFVRKMLDRFSSTIFSKGHFQKNKGTHNNLPICSFIMILASISLFTQSSLMQPCQTLILHGYKYSVLKSTQSREKALTKRPPEAQYSDWQQMCSSIQDFLEEVKKQKQQNQLDYNESIPAGKDQHINQEQPAINRISHLPQQEEEKQSCTCLQQEEDSYGMFLQERLEAELSLEEDQKLKKLRDKQQRIDEQQRISYISSQTDEEDKDEDEEEKYQKDDQKNNQEDKELEKKEEQEEEFDHSLIYQWQNRLRLLTEQTHSDDFFFEQAKKQIKQRRDGIPFRRYARER